MLTVATAGLAVVAVWLVSAGRPRPVAAFRQQSQGPPRGAFGVERWRTAPVAVAVGVVGGAALIDVPVLLLPTIALLGWAASVLVARARRDAQAVTRRERVVEACEAMLGELVAGRPPVQALDRAAGVWDELASTAGAAHLGVDVPTALRPLARLPGARAVDRLAGVWQLCGSSGSGLATALEQVLGSVRAEHEVALAVRSELSSARATARLLAVLPVLVLVMAQGIGADPWRFLLATVPGQLCLGTGVALGVAGVMWLERIADEAQGERR
jgi:tight adherence protein B